MPTGVNSWSKTASANATADSAVNWAEGQAPSSVNDSARATMASVAMWRDDTNGSIVTGGSATALTVASNQGFSALSELESGVIAFVPHTTSGAAVTLSVDGLTAKKVRISPNVDLPDAVLIQGTPYVVTYLASNGGEFILQNFTNPYSIMLGAGIEYWGTTAPNSAFAFPYGQALSRTVYASLFTLFGTTYGSGDGTTTFNIPDKRGRASFAKDNMGGSTASRITSAGGIVGTTLGAVGGAETHTLTAAQTPVLSGTGVTNTTGAHTHTVGGGDNIIIDPAGSTDVVRQQGSRVTSSAGDHSHTVSVTVNSGGGAAFPKLSPGIVCNYLIRVL